MTEAQAILRGKNLPELCAKPLRTKPAPRKTVRAAPPPPPPSRRSADPVAGAVASDVGSCAAVPAGSCGVPAGSFGVAAGSGVRAGSCGTTPPADLVGVIQSMARLAAFSGPGFEERTLREHDQNKYQFLLPDNEYHAYYCWQRDLAVQERAERLGGGVPAGSCTGVPAGSAVPAPGIHAVPPAVDAGSCGAGSCGVHAEDPPPLGSPFSLQGEPPMAPPLPKFGPTLRAKAAAFKAKATTSTPPSEWLGPVAPCPAFRKKKKRNPSWQKHESG